MKHAAPIARAGAPKGLALLAILLLCACPNKQHQSVDSPEDKSTHTTEAAEVTTQPSLKRAPRADYASLDGLVHAPRPTGEGWQCIRQAAHPPQPPATLIKCRRTDPERFFFLMAKDYEVAPSRRLPVDAIVSDVLPLTYSKLFSSYTITEIKTIEQQGAQGLELTIDALHGTLGSIHKRERLFVRANHVLVISAEGQPELFELYAADIDAWMLGASFLNLSLE